MEKKGLAFSAPAPWDESQTVGESLLTPTRIYVKQLLRLTNKGLLKGMAHITGGGLYENVPRMLPKTLAAEIDVATWTVPPVFRWLKQAGNVSSTEFARAWNTGLGMVCVVAKEQVAAVVELLSRDNETVYIIGQLVPRETEGCVLKNLAAWD